MSNPNLKRAGAFLVLVSAGVLAWHFTSQASADRFSSAATSPPGAREVTGDRRSTNRRATADERADAVVGMKLDQPDAAGKEAWAHRLSRNPEEYAARLHDLKHVLKAEVVRFTALEDQAELLNTDKLPVTISLPGLDGQPMNVMVSRLNLDGPKSGTLSGRMVGSPDTTVVLGFHEGEVSGFIEGPGRVAVYDAFDQQAVILRELDAAGHAADFDCDCMVHQREAMRKEAAHPSGVQR